MDQVSSVHGERADPGKQCSFCLRDVAALEHLVSAPAVSICSDCVRRCVSELQEQRVDGWRPWWDPRRRRPAQGDDAATVYRTGDRSCSFCGEERVAETIFGENARICSPCVRLAVDVVREARDSRR